MNDTRSTLRSYILAIAVWIATFVVAMKIGAVTDASVDVLVELRLPRTLAASAIGAGLAVSGAALQALFANPLCEPYTLGISSGSALGAVLGASLGLNWMFSGLVGTAFLGALLFAGILYLISLREEVGSLTLLLTGVMMGFLGTSLVSIWLALSDANGIQAAILWLFGDLTRVRLDGAVFTFFGVAALCVFIWMRWRDLDALLMGEEDAISMGVEISSVRRRLILLISLMIGLCVSAGGMIGFIGLVIPHFVRKTVGSLHQRLIPLCAVWGAVALVVSDTLARSAVRPYELPVGVVTALVGAPAFLWIMIKRRGIR